MTESLVTEAIITDSAAGLAANRATLTRPVTGDPAQAVATVAAGYVAQGWTVAAPAVITGQGPTLALRHWVGDRLIARVTITAYRSH